MCNSSVSSVEVWQRIHPGRPLGPLPHLTRAAVLFDTLICCEDFFLGGKGVGEVRRKKGRVRL